MRLNDTLAFLHAGCATHVRLAPYLAPAALARLMTDDECQPDGRVTELCPGSGAFTGALLARGVAPCPLVLIVTEPNFADTLARRYPGTILPRLAAARLGDIDPCRGKSVPGPW